MKPNELRIGNYVLDSRDNEIHIVSGNTIHSMQFDDKEILQPIILTEEWLVKLGFKKTQKFKQYFLPIPNIKCEIHAERFRGVIVLEIHNHVMPIIPETESSVHGLQNLYFALCGKELT